MNGDNQPQSESSVEEDCNFRETADAINDVANFVDNTKTAVKITQGMGTAVAVGGVTAGLSGGAGMMAGLAAIGGSAVGGIGVLGVAPTAAVKMMMNQVLADDDRLSTEERDARAVGRVATNVGAVVGTAAPVVAISTFGTVAGLSGAGITSGLAAIGGTVGGSMGAGIAITVAAPAVIAASVGYGAYKIWQWMTSTEE